MDWLGAGKAISEPIKAVGDLYTTDKARIEAETKLQEVLQKPTLAQLDINRILASSADLYKSGGIALITWTCGFLIWLYYCPQIVIMLWIWGHKCMIAGIISPFPMRPDELLNLVGLIITGKVHNFLTSITKK
jgi:hypothetical protein